MKRPFTTSHLRTLESTGTSQLFLSMLLVLLQWLAERQSQTRRVLSFFFLLKESELTPSGTNILDGRYSVFGYVIDGQDLLRELKAGDFIKSIKIVDGSENLVNGTRDSAAMSESTLTAEMD